MPICAIIDDTLAVGI